MSKAYIGIERCGCVTAIMVAGVETPKQEQRQVAKLIKSGRKVEIVSTDEARKRWEPHCPHGEVVDDPNQMAMELVAAAGKT